MVKVADNHHLIRRKSVWYYSRRTPDLLIKELGSRFIRYSLGTKNKKEAIKRREVEDLKWSARLEAAEQQCATTLSDAPSFQSGPAPKRLRVDLIRDYVARVDRRSEELFAHDPPETKVQRQDVVMDATLGIQILQNPEDPRGADWIQQVARQIQGESGPPADPVFDEQVRRGLIELQARRLARFRDDRSRSYFDFLFDPAQPPEVTFGELAEQFITLKQEEGSASGTSKKTLDKQQANAALVRAIVGNETLVATITYDTCLQVRGTLAQVPANWTKLFKGLSLEEAIKKAAALGKPTLSPLTQQQYLATFKELLDLAMKKRLIPSNPADGIRPLKRDDVALRDKRQPFTPEQIRDFFQCEFYLECARSHPEPFRADQKGGWRFWLPLLSIWTGLRPREICQALVHDVRQTKGGTWYLDVVASGQDDDSPIRKTLKTASSRRTIPLHPQLIRCGFLDFVESVRSSSSDPRLFPTLKPNKFGDPAWYALKQFNEHYLDRATERGERQSFYSFRHSFRDALRRIEAPPDVLQAVGWSQGSRVVSDNYGSQLGPDHLSNYIKRLDYPGLDLGHLWCR
jgi:integrase